MLVGSVSHFGARWGLRYSLVHIERWFCAFAIAKLQKILQSLEEMPSHVKNRCKRKPFAAIGFEYNRVAVQSGTARLNSDVQFSIPQFGDFFNDMVLHVVLGAVDAQNAAYWSDPAANPANGTELLAYVNFVGQRLCQKVQFTVNGNPLDQYDQEVYNFHNKFFICPHKRFGWNTDVGQENPHQGFSDVAQANGRAGRGAGVRIGQQVFDGPQTPAPTQGPVEMWIPLLFWFKSTLLN